MPAAPSLTGRAPVRVCVPELSCESGATKQLGVRRERPTIASMASVAAAASA